MHVADAGVLRKFYYSMVEMAVCILAGLRVLPHLMVVAHFVRLGLLLPQISLPLLQWLLM